MGQILHFNKILRWFLCTLKFVTHYSLPPLNGSHWDKCPNKALTLGHLCTLFLLSSSFIFHLRSLFLYHKAYSLYQSLSEINVYSESNIYVYWGKRGPPVVSAVDPTTGWWRDECGEGEKLNARAQHSVMHSMHNSWMCELFRCHPSFLSLLFSP